MKKGKPLFKGKNIIKDLRFHQRMLLVYLVGGILPLLVTGLYTNYQTRSMMIDLSKETQTEELSLIASSIQESMSVAGNVVRLLSEDDQVRKMTRSVYTNQFDFLKDVTNLSAIKDYLNYYKQDISRITIYLNNESLNQSVIEDADNISYLGKLVMNQEWYKKAAELKDLEYWHYGKDDNGLLSLMVTSVMRDSNEDVIAVVTVTMQYWKTAEAIDERDVDTILLYNDKEMVYSNIKGKNDYPFSYDSLSKYMGTSYSKKVVTGVEEHLLTYQTVKPTDSINYYSLVSVQKYQEIMSNINKITLKAFLPEIIGMVISIILIIGFAVIYDRRINQMRMQMHRVARGEYAKVEPIEGDDEIGALYQELERMIQDIQMLMAKVVEEKVQKEKLHTRQKEVEFKMLASQINPHFLYNTLETIRMKAVVNHQSEIEELVKMLAKLMRYNIQVTDQMVLLQSEIQLVEYYLKIQNYRFGDRITSQVIIDETVDMNTPVMPLMIQPFVENAFAHGLEEKDSDGRLIIHVKSEEDNIIIIVRDNGVGMDYYTLGQLKKSMREENSDQTHIGVHNVNQRLLIQYGEEYGVEIESSLNIGTKITIKIPVSD